VSRAARDAEQTAEGYIEAGKLAAFLRHLINAWGFDLIRPEAAKIGIAHIVIEDDNKVGLFCM
jgi:hypothetical protein